MPLVSSDNHYLKSYIRKRQGETRLGEVIYPFDLSDEKDYVANLKELKGKGVRFILIGIPEDIGPRANMGKPGAHKGWHAFLSKFCSLQQNEFIKGEQIAVMGHIDCHDLQDLSVNLGPNNAEHLNQLRSLVSMLDERVFEICQLIFNEKLTPIIIGGGHNNAYPILKAASISYGSPLNAINLDPHTDFRVPEGRHSGNPFSYAAKEGYLKNYFNIGMHELKNSSANLEALKSNGFKWLSYQDIWVRREHDFDSAIEKGKNYIKKEKLPFGIELDVDSISLMPVSAYTNCGIQVKDAEYYTYSLGKEVSSCYLHLAEGAPEQHPSNYDSGISEVGQVYSSLVISFIQAKQGL